MILITQDSNENHIFCKQLPEKFSLECLVATYSVSVRKMVPLKLVRVEQTWVLMGWWKLLLAHFPQPHWQVDAPNVFPHHQNHHRMNHQPPWELLKEIKHVELNFVKQFKVTTKIETQRCLELFPILCIFDCGL